MDNAQISQDLHFVRAAVARQESTMPRPAPVYFYWAAYVLVGFTLIDFAPIIANWFFLIGTVLGMAFSGIYARHSFARQGQVDRAMGMRQFAHWFGGMCIAIGVPVIMANLYQPAFSGPLAGQMCAILIGLVYFMAGVYIDRPFLWMGLLLVAGGVCIGLVPHYGWTILGILLSASLATTALIGTKARPLGSSMSGLGNCGRTSSETPAA